MNKYQRFWRITGPAVAVAIAVGTALATSSPAHAADTWSRINAYHSNLVASVPSPYTANGLRVEQQPYGSNAWNGQWKLTPKGIGNQTFEFQNRYSSQCLDVESAAAGAAVVQNPCDNSLSQKWTRWQDPVEKAWHILNNWSGLYLAVENGSLAAGAHFVQVNYSANVRSQMMQTW